MTLKKSIVLVLTFFFLSSPALSAEERGIKAPASESQKPTILGNYVAFIVGINIEIVSGLEKTDKLKIWDKPIKK